MLRKIAFGAGATLAALGIAASLPGTATAADSDPTMLRPGTTAHPGTTPPSGDTTAPPAGTTPSSPSTPPQGLTPRSAGGFWGAWTALRWYPKTLEGRARCGIEAAAYTNSGHAAQCQSSPTSYVLMAYVPAYKGFNPDDYID